MTHSSGFSETGEGMPLRAALRACIWFSSQNLGCIFFRSCSKSFNSFCCIFSYISLKIPDFFSDQSLLNVLKSRWIFSSVVSSASIATSSQLKLGNISNHEYTLRCLNRLIQILKEVDLFQRIVYSVLWIRSLELNKGSLVIEKNVAGSLLS